MFHFTWFALSDYVFIAEFPVFLPERLPHSEILGSKPVAASRGISVLTPSFIASPNQVIRA